MSERRKDFFEELSDHLPGLVSTHLADVLMSQSEPPSYGTKDGRITLWIRRPDLADGDLHCVVVETRPITSEEFSKVTEAEEDRVTSAFGKGLRIVGNDQ